MICLWEWTTSLYLLTLLNVLLNLFGLHGEPMDDAITFVSASNSNRFLDSIPIYQVFQIYSLIQVVQIV